VPVLMLAFLSSAAWPQAASTPYPTMARDSNT
jgi:hypothetical protein